MNEISFNFVQREIHFENENLQREQVIILVNVTRKGKLVQFKNRKME